MRCVQLLEIGQPLVDRDVPRPVPGPMDALVRVEAAGICRSDLHYRSGASFAGPLPLTLGHESAGVVEGLGAEAASSARELGIEVGGFVAVHYLISCGSCRFCMAGHEQFCVGGAMIGKHVDGGFAEFLRVPVRNLVPIPDGVPVEWAAVMMCSTVTAVHALHKAEFTAGDRVAVYGVGGLGMSAVQLALAMGALEVYAIDIDSDRLARAARLGAVTIHARNGDTAGAIYELSGGGVDVAIELLGLPETIDAAIRSLAPLGRAAIAGIAETPVSINTYRDLVGREACVVGVSDHTRAEVAYVLALASRGKVSFDEVITAKVPLEAAAVNRVLDGLAAFAPGVRAIVVPGASPTSLL